MINTTSLALSLLARMRLKAYEWRNNWRLFRLTRQLATHSRLNQASKGSGGAQVSQRPVLFFNASTRLTGISLNAAFSLIAAWGLHLAGVPVIHFVSRKGMTRCVLGTNRDDPGQLPPCTRCVAQSGWLFAHAPVVWFEFIPDAKVSQALQGLSVEMMAGFEYDGWPLGELVLPSLRWVLRRHTLLDDQPTRSLFREYIRSAYSTGQQFEALVEKIEPQAVVLFNGMFFPEATARWAAQARGLRVITHEVGLNALSAFFTTGEATAYPLEIPADFELTVEENTLLDHYLDNRTQGQFSMAGIRFWPAMVGLDEDFLERAASFRGIVPVFTNVVFDTSQPHSNVLYPHMFAWLDDVLDCIRSHSDTLFVIRAHPDENRPGKESRESVREWVARNQVERFPNAVFIDADQPVSSYELIRRAKFVMIYNSTIGLEASLKGAAVLCAGKARFTQYPTVYFPESQAAYRQLLEAFLNADEVIPPPEFARNARRFLYYQLFRSSLPFNDFIEEGVIWPGFVRLRSFSWDRLARDGSITMRVLLDGILEAKPFIMPRQERMVVVKPE